MLEAVCNRLGADLTGAVLHSDNGKPMKGSSMLSTMQFLGIVPSFSRPHVSDDNPFVEAIFRTLKYRPGASGLRFDTLEEAKPATRGVRRRAIAMRATPTQPAFPSILGDVRIGM